MHTNQDIESRGESLHPRKIGDRKWIRIALWVMAVALVGWYFLGEDAQRPEVADGANQPTPDTSSMGEGEASSAFRVPFMNRRSREESPETPSAMATGKGDQAREIIGRIRNDGKKMDLGEIFERAERFRDRGMLVDAHLMYFFAAKQGHAESALVLGTMYDPEHALEVSSVIEEPDWTQAHKWYLRAAEGGNEIARGRLEYLRKQVERAAANGDSEAGRLVLQWQ